MDFLFIMMMITKSCGIKWSKSIKLVTFFTCGALWAMLASWLHCTLASLCHPELFLFPLDFTEMVQPKSSFSFFFPWVNTVWSIEAAILLPLFSSTLSKLTNTYIRDQMALTFSTRALSICIDELEFICKKKCSQITHKKVYQENKCGMQCALGG